MSPQLSENNNNGNAHHHGNGNTNHHSNQNFTNLNGKDFKDSESSAFLSNDTNRSSGLEKKSDQNGQAKISSKREDVVEFNPPDGGWGWLVCAASFWTNGTIFGIINTFGIMYVALLKEFDQGDETKDIAFKTSWIGSLQITTTFFMSIIASMLVDRFGIRVTSFAGALIATIGMFASSFVYSLELMYLTYGCMVGIGSSLIYTPSMVILGHYFKRHLGIVNGIVTFGSAVFTFILPFAEQALLQNIGLRHTMKVLAGLFAVLILCSLIWKPLFNPRHTELDHYLTSTDSIAQKCAGCCRWTSKFCNVSIWKNKGYIVWVIALPVSFLGYFIPFVHLVKHTLITLPEAKPEILLMCIGATSGVSRLVFGKVADLPRINRVRMQQFAFLVMGVVTTCIPFAKNFYVLVAIVLIMGICDGCMVCLMGPIAFDLLGPKGAAQGLGCLLGLMSLPMTAGPPLAGLVYDHMKTYNIAFWAAGAPPIIGGLILFLMPKSVSEIKTKRVTEVEAVASMSMENLDTVCQPEEHVYVDKDGKRHVLLIKDRVYKPWGDLVTYSVPNLTTCKDTGVQSLINTKRNDPDNISLG